MTFLDAKGQVKEVQKIRVAEEDLNTLCDKIKKNVRLPNHALVIIKIFKEQDIFPFRRR